MDKIQCHAFTIKACLLYSVIYNAPVRAEPVDLDELISYFRSVVTAWQASTLKHPRLRYAARFSECAVKYLLDQPTPSTEKMGTFINPNSLFEINLTMDTTARMTIGSIEYGLVDRSLADVGKLLAEFTAVTGFVEELNKIEAVYENLTYREGSDPANVAVQGVMRQLLELRFAVSVFYFTLDQSKMVADILNRIEKLSSEFLDDTFSAAALYRRVQCRKPS